MSTPTPTKRRGPWSSVEDQQLMAYIAADPTLNWVNISLQVQSRTPKQCRERYHQNLKDSLNHSPITAAEGILINNYVMKNGKRWADIARQLNGRSDNAVKNWWNGNQNRIKRAEQRRRTANESTLSSNALSPAVRHAHEHLNQLYSRAAPPPPPPAHHRHQHRHSSGSMQDLVDAAELQNRQRESYHQQTYEQGYASVSLPPPRQYHESYLPPASSLSREILRETQYQPQPQETRPALYAPASNYDLSSRRASIYAASPSAESDVPPSLVSDHGSPCERGSASHVWPSPDLVELPPMLNINGSFSKDRATGSVSSSPITQYALPASASRRVSLTAETAYAPSFRHSQQPEEIEDAARAIMNLPKSHDHKDNHKRGHLDLHDLLN